MKVNDEPSCDVLFRNSSKLLGGSSPQGPRRQDNRRRGGWAHEENRVKDAFSQMLCAAQGQQREKASLTSMPPIITPLQIIVPCWSSVIILSVCQESFATCLLLLCLLCVNGLLFYFINDARMCCKTGDLETKMHVYTAAGSEATVKAANSSKKYFKARNCLCFYGVEEIRMRSFRLYKPQVILSIIVNSGRFSCACTATSLYRTHTNGCFFN